MKKLITIVIAALCATAAFCQNSINDVKVGPWVTEVTDSSMTVLWTSKTPGQAWVELEDGSRVWETFAGRRVFGRMHSVEIGGLTAGTSVKYRVGGRLVTNDSNPRDPEYGSDYCGDWHNVRTTDGNAQTCRFTVLNDIHMRCDSYTAMARRIAPSENDFLFLNGDIASAGNYCIDSLVKYSIAPLEGLAGDIPMFFARGNHEGRGNNPQIVSQVYPNREGRGFYYTFRQGPVAFIVFDAGETHEDRCQHYAGGEVYEDYLMEQKAWAVEAMKAPSFADAPVKVCLLHVPMIDHPDKSDYLLQRWLNVNFVPMLNEAGIDMMIGADLHEYRFDEPGTMGNDFPIITNKDARRLTFEYAEGKIAIRTYNPNGDLEHVYDYNLSE